MANLEILGSRQGAVLEVKQTKAVVRSALGGELRTISVWNATKRITIEYRALTTTFRNNFITFLEQNLGLEFTYVDEHGVEWTGIIVDPEVDFTQISRVCDFSVQLTLEVE